MGLALRKEWDPNRSRSVFSLNIVDPIGSMSDFEAKEVLERTKVSDM